ncbi:MAG: hypothetical protein JSS09_09735, partial [Verrucomicrobia bacterium]|nr:hypothetical protein [Verrucomicrobiota bacterium]
MKLNCIAIEAKRVLQSIQIVPLCLSHGKIVFASLFAGTLVGVAATKDAKLSVIFSKGEILGESASFKIKSLIKKRLKSEELELERLQSVPNISKALSNVSRKLGWINEKLDVKQSICIAHSLELREALKKTHYVINHAQANNIIGINIVAKKIKELFESKKYEHFEVLRHDVFLRKSYKDLNYYKSSYGFKDDGLINLDDRAALISGDIYLESFDHNESAIDFFILGERSNRMGEGFYIAKLLISRIIFEYFPDKEFAWQIATQLVDLMKDEKGSTLYSICILKSRFNEM